MGRPRKASTLDRRASVRLSDQTYEAYEEIAQLVGVLTGQLMRQVLTLEAQELRTLVAGLQQSSPETRPFVEADGALGIGRGGGLSQRLRRELLDRQLQRVRGTHADASSSPVTP